MFSYEAFIIIFYLSSNSPRVYNCTSGQINPIKWIDFGKMTTKYAISNPTKYVMLYPGFTYRKNRVVHKFIEFFYHFLPAYCFDIIMRLQGSKPIMMKIAKRFQRAADTGEFFAMHEWIFENGNLKQLINSVKQMRDGYEFPCDMSTLDWESYVQNYMLGIRKYVLKDDDSTIKSAKQKLKILYWTKIIFQISIVLSIYQVFLKDLCK